MRKISVFAFGATLCLTSTLGLAATDWIKLAEWRCRGHGTKQYGLVQIDVSIMSRTGTSSPKPFVLADIRTSRTQSWDDLGVHMSGGVSGSCEITSQSDGKTILRASWAVNQIDPFEGAYESYLGMDIAADGKTAKMIFDFEHDTDHFVTTCVPN